MERYQHTVQDHAIYLVLYMDFSKSSKESTIAIPLTGNSAARVAPSTVPYDSPL